MWLHVCQVRNMCLPPCLRFRLWWGAGMCLGQKTKITKLSIIRIQKNLVEWISILLASIQKMLTDHLLWWYSDPCVVQKWVRLSPCPLGSYRPRQSFVWKPETEIALSVCFIFLPPCNPPPAPPSYASCSLEFKL